MPMSHLDRAQQVATLIGRMQGPGAGIGIRIWRRSKADTEIVRPRR